MCTPSFGEGYFQPFFTSLTDITRYIPGYLKELKDGHAEELALFKRQLSVVKKQMARLLLLSINSAR
jgi:hypothetical protein